MSCLKKSFVAFCDNDADIPFAVRVLVAPNIVTDLIGFISKCNHIKHVAVYHYLRQSKSSGIKCGKAHICVSVANTNLEVACTKIDSASDIKNSNYMLFHICDIVRFFILFSYTDSL